jgi:hypothetical protein
MRVTASQVVGSILIARFERQLGDFKAYNVFIIEQFTRSKKGVRLVSQVKGKLHGTYCYDDAQMAGVLSLANSSFEYPALFKRERKLLRQVKPLLLPLLALNHE